MTEWRVIKHSEQGFEVQRKGWLFWSSCHSASMGIGATPLFRSLDEAKGFIAQQQTPPVVVYEE